MLGAFVLFVIFATITVACLLLVVLEPLLWFVVLVSLPLTFFSFMGWQILKYLDIQVEILTKLYNDKKTP